MSTLVYTNNAQSTLLEGVTATATTITLALNTGGLFPDISEADDKWFPLTLINPDDSTYEIVRAIARDGDAIIVDRAQENTPEARSFTAGTIVSLRMSSAAFDAFVKTGDTTLTVLSGLNVAVQTNSTTDPYEVFLEGVTQFVDGMIIRFAPTVALTEVTSLLRLKVNSLDAKLIVSTSTAFSASAWQIDNFRTGVVHTLQYDASRDQFWLMSPQTKVVAAAQLLPGLSAGMLPANQIYDSTSDPDQVTGYPEFADRRSVSKIIDDYVEKSNLATTDDTDSLLSAIPLIWKWYGTGVLGSRTGNAILDISINYVPMYETLDVYSAGHIRCRHGNGIVRATVSMSLGCEISPQQASTQVYPFQFYGPQGAPVTNSAIPTGEDLPTYIRHQELVGTFGDVFTAQSYWTSLSFMMANGFQFEQLHGGHGGGYAALKSVSRLVYGRSSIMLVAPSITLTDTCKVNLSTRAVNTTSVEDNLTGGQGTLAADTTQAGGGVLLLCAESVTIEDQAEFSCGEGFPDSKTWNSIEANYYTDGVLTSDPFDSFRNAAPGIVLHFNTSNGKLVRLV